MIAKTIIAYCFALAAEAAFGLEIPCTTRANVVVDRQEIDAKVEKVPSIAPFTYEAKDGQLLRDGKPFYWIADGSDLGGIHATPLGLWLAKLQGTSWASVMHSTCQVMGYETNGVVHIAPRLAESCFSWMREAIRLGLLTQCPEGFFAFQREQLARIIVKHPELLQDLYDHGHHMGADPGSELGLKTVDAKRYPLFAYGEKTGFFLPELNRESGPDPYNDRVKKGFRVWAAKKYGTLAEANRVWKTSFATWDDVILRHTVETVVGINNLTNKGWSANRPVVLGIRNRRARVRAQERRETPELYFDWMQYVKADTSASTAQEFAAVRKYAPNSLVGMDVRGHQSSRDNYGANDPIVIDNLANVFYVHASGFKCYDYRNQACDVVTLRNAICWPLFTARYFRCNTTKPILNSEDIIANTIAAGVSVEALEENDFAKLQGVKFKFGKVNDGGTSFSATFTLPARLENDRADGSRRFYLAGVSPCKIGWFSVNGGKSVGSVRTAGQFFSFDVTDKIYFDRPNRISGYISGLKGEPVNPGCHIVSGDLLGHQSPYGKNQYLSQYWSYMMGGHAGVIVWHWQNDDRMRLYQAEITKRLEAAAEIAMPDLRFRREDVAFLYSYDGGVGLPAASEGRHHELMSWAAALEFTGHRYDVLGEEFFQKHAAKYPLIVAPDIWCCHEATIEAAKNYVKGGGTLVITPGSLGKTFTRYAESGFAAFASGDTGKGRVITFEPGQSIEQLAAKFSPLVSAPKLEVEIATADGKPTKEFPCIERVMAGDATRKVLYFQNWGGIARRVRAKLPKEMQGWKLTPLEGEWNAGDFSAVVEGSQGIATCILSAPDARLPATELDAKTRSRIAQLADIMTFGREAPGKKRVLFAYDVGTRSSETYSGVELFPHMVQAARACGAEVDALAVDKWTPEILSKYALVVLTEGNFGMWKEFFKKKETRKMFKDYVNNGGAIFADIYAGLTSCCIASFFWFNGDICPIRFDKRGYARDEVSYGYGDPRQVLTKNVKPHEITEGVKSVQLFALNPMELFKPVLTNIVALPETSNAPEASVMAVREYGKGRFAVSVDPMAFQPDRIIAADNATLLVNLMGWLLREPVTPEIRTSFNDQVKSF